jgi:hypothetical protein
MVMEKQSAIDSRLVTIYPQDNLKGNKYKIVIERWNQTNIYYPTPASLSRLILLTAGKYPIMRFDFVFPRVIKVQERHSLLVGGHWHEVEF